MSGVTNLINHIKLPKFVKAHQIFEHNELTEAQITEMLSKGFENPEITSKINRVCVFALPVAAEVYQICLL